MSVSALGKNHEPVSDFLSFTVYSSMRNQGSLSPKLADLYRHVCWVDMHALKPGNTGIHSSDPVPSVEDFLSSAQVSAESMAAPALTLGERVLRAVQATHLAVGTNTNLGIILLVAPLIQACLRRETGSDLAKSLWAVLRQSTVQDAKKVYQAIRMAEPGGMGHKQNQDIYEEPTVTLLNTMKYASSWDRIANQYSNNYHDILFFGAPHFEALMARWNDECWAATGLFLAFLSRFPDSLIERKFGVLKAREISDMITPLEKEFCRSDSPVRFKSRLLEIDSCLKRDRINPGTTADLTVASIFAEGLGML